MQNPMEYTVHGILQARIPALAYPSPGHLPNPGIEPKSPTLQADSLPAEPPGKPQNNAWNVVNPVEMSGVVVVAIIQASPLTFRCV